MHEHDLGDVRYCIDHDKRIINAERHDDLTKSGVYAEWKAIQQLDGFDPAYDTIVDYSYVPCVDLDASDIMELSREITTHDPRTGNVAIISGLKHGRYLLARFFCKIANLIVSRKHQVFQTRIEAELWLSTLREHE